MQTVHYVMKNTTGTTSRIVKWRVMTRAIKSKFDAEGEMDFLISQDKKNSRKYFIVSKDISEE